MTRGELDAGELLVRALDQVVGGIALARYAASRTEDTTLRGLFRQLATTGEQQERLLRRQLSRHLPGSGPQAMWGRAQRLLVRVIITVLASTAIAGVAVLARRVLGSQRLQLSHLTALLPQRVQRAWGLGRHGGPGSGSATRDDAVNPYQWTAARS